MLKAHVPSVTAKAKATRLLSPGSKLPKLSSATARLVPMPEPREKQ